MHVKRPYGGLLLASSTLHVPSPSRVGKCALTKPQFLSQRIAGVRWQRLQNISAGAAGLVDAAHHFVDIV